MYLTGIAAYIFCRSDCAVRRELQQIHYFSPCSHFEVMPSVLVLVLIHSLHLDLLNFFF